MIEVGDKQKGQNGSNAEFLTDNNRMNSIEELIWIFAIPKSVEQIRHEMMGWIHNHDFCLEAEVGCKALLRDYNFQLWSGIVEPNRHEPLFWFE